MSREEGDEVKSKLAIYRNRVHKVRIGAMEKLPGKHERGR